MKYEYFINRPNDPHFEIEMAFYTSLFLAEHAGYEKLLIQALDNALEFHLEC